MGRELLDSSRLIIFAVFIREGVICVFLIRMDRFYYGVELVKDEGL